MSLTNKTGIAKPLAGAIEILYGNHPAPEEGTYFVTELLKGPKEVLLNRLHRDEVEKDIQDIIDAVLGTAWHKAIESLIVSQGDVNCLTEQRFKAPVNLETAFGFITVYISGAVDLVYHDERGNHIIDWKMCKLAKCDKARSGEEEDWKKQLFLYAWLLEKAGMSRPVDGTIYAFPKDLTQRDYDIENPERLRVQKIAYDFSDRAYEQKVIEEYTAKLTEIVNNVMMGDDPRPCTPDEMWQNPPSFAVKKPENKTAAKVCSSVSEATAYLQSKGWIGKGYMIYERPSQPVKCCDWCDARQWCEQGKKAIEEWENSSPKTYSDKGVSV